MKRIIAVVSACCLIGLASVPGPARADVRSALQAQYDRFNASLVGKNVAGIAAVCTADCKLRTRPGGPALSLDEFRQATTQQFNSVVVKHARTTINSITTSGNTAHVRAVWTGDLASTAGKAAARHIHSVQRLSDTWRKTPAGWRLQASAVTAVHTTVAGRPARERQREERR